MEVVKPNRPSIHLHNEGFGPRCANPLIKILRESHCQQAFTESIYLIIRLHIIFHKIPKLKACVKAPRISPTSLSLNEAARFQGLKPWLDVEGVDSQPSWKSTCLTFLTFLLLRANSSCSSLERERECSMSLALMYLFV